LKGSRVERARHDINESIQRSWAQMEAVVRPKDASVVVFYSLNWHRSGIVETDIRDRLTCIDRIQNHDWAEGSRETHAT
jgi:hypothetical protein